MESRAASVILFHFATFEVDIARKTLPRSATHIKIQDQRFASCCFSGSSRKKLSTLKALLENLRPKGICAP